MTEQGPDPAERDPIIIALRSLYSAGEQAGDSDILRLAEGIEFLYRLEAAAGAEDLVDVAAHRIAAGIAQARSGGQIDDEGAAGDPPPEELRL